MKQRIEKDLNPVQQKAVKDTEGPSLIIAGAGSGKTRVLTYRIACLLSKNVDPSSILALTFTNKAAKEMKNRIKDMVGEKKAIDLWMGTFHSIFARILRSEAPLLRFNRNFTIFDQADSRNLIKKIIKDFRLDTKEYPPKEIQSRVSMAKNNLMTFQAYKNDPELIKEDRKRHKGEFYRIYERYAITCKKNNVMDFDDLLLFTNILFKKFPETLTKYQHKFKYILVDEYQDTNFAQYLILKNLAKQHKNICVVGDDSQSIYAFRGAKIENILNFQKDYPGCKMTKLERNYRSTQTIVNAANSLIAKNTMRIKKSVFSKNAAGNKIVLARTENDTDEAFYIADEIATTQKDLKINLDEIAILYRTNAQSRQLEEALRKSNIPHRIYAGLSFYQRKEIKDIVAYFRFVVNTGDEEALLRIINYPSRKIGGKTIEKLQQFANAKNHTLWQTIRDIYNPEIPLNTPTKQRIAKFAALIDQLKKAVNETDAYNMGEMIIKRSGIFAELQADKSVEGTSRFQNMQELLNSIQEYIDKKQTEKPNVFISLSDYLENIALLSTQDTGGDDDNEPKVNLMTIHAAKGLEFDVVFIAGAEEGLFPGIMATFYANDLEEERRLFYVAMTRARKKLVITSASMRYKFGDVTFPDPSRFIKDIDPQFTEDVANEDDSIDPFDTMFEEKGFDKPSHKHASKPATKHKKKAPPPKVATPFNPNKLSRISDVKQRVRTESSTGATDIQTGQHVRHDRFGKGVVVSVEDQGGDRKAIVNFDKEGKKTLLLKYARLKILS
ncbi:MAG: 3'-5' exonuclease [Bacteroidota bacterium]|nr:3'-5' exonuclease [Bacteroidota bacterium]